MTEELKAFYKAYAAWLDAGAVNNGVFTRCTGLCFALHKWAGDKGYSLRALRLELKAQLIDAGLDSGYPFNCGERDYDVECDDETIHLNPVRIAWVRKHATD